MAEDKISELPIHIIYDILGRIGNYRLKEAARTSVLSKTWNSIWRHRPDVIISQSFYKKSPEKFVQFIDDSLRPHVEQNLRIKTLRLMNLHPQELASHMDRWIEMATKLNVMFLAIDISCSKSLYYNIPDAIYAAKTLTKLWLYQCNFEIDNNNNSTTDKLQRLISTCPLIRDLRLSVCTGLQNNLHLSGLENLETLELRKCDKVEKVEIWAPNLRKFVYVGMPLHKWPKKREPESLPCTIDILDCYNTLEYLHLEDTTMTDQQFEYQLSKFTALETLKLTGCYLMKNIKVVSEKLKRFSLWDWGNVEQVNMMLAPNLKTFDFDGFKMPFSISTVDPSKLERANLNFFLMPQFRESYIFGDVDASWRILHIHKGAIENYEENGGKSRMYTWLKSTSLIERITTFTFKWEKRCHS